MVPQAGYVHTTHKPEYIYDQYISNNRTSSSSFHQHLKLLEFNHYTSARRSFRKRDNIKKIGTLHKCRDPTKQIAKYDIPKEAFHTMSHDKKSILQLSWAALYVHTMKTNGCFHKGDK